MYGFIFGFQRCVWWPKWTPASSSWRIEKSGNAMPLCPFPVEPPQGEQHSLRECHRAEPSGFLPDNPMPYVWNGGAHTGDPAGMQGRGRKLTPKPPADAARPARSRRAGCHILRRTGPITSTADLQPVRSEEHTSELQSLMRTSYAAFC